MGAEHEGGIARPGPVEQKVDSSIPDLLLDDPGCMQILLQEIRHAPFLTGSRAYAQHLYEQLKIHLEIDIS